MVCLQLWRARLPTRGRLSPMAQVTSPHCRENDMPETRAPVGMTAVATEDCTLGIYSVCNAGAVCILNPFNAWPELTPVPDGRAAAQVERQSG